jgi:ribonuclease HI
MKWTAYIDGGARGNPGPAGAGVYLLDENGKVRFSGGFFLGRQTNNQAEYTGLVKALDLLSRSGTQHIEIISDSELMVRQITGIYRVKSARIKPLFEEARRLLEQFDEWEIRHVRRENNTQADQLANEAMDAGEDVSEIDTLGAESSADKAPSDFSKEQFDGRRVPRIEVRVVHSADPAVCPAAPARGEAFIFGATTPAEFCVDGCAAVIETVRIMQQQGGEDAGSTSRTVCCARKGCGAVFEIRPVGSE